MSVKSFIIIFASLLLISSGTINSQVVGEKSIKYVGRLIKLHPEYEERFIVLYKHMFPEVIDRMKKSNLRNYSIFLQDGMLFSIYEYAGDDFEKDIKEISNEATRDWWKLTDPMQEPLPDRKEGEWWAEMDIVLKLDKKIKESNQAQRIAVTADIVPGKEEEFNSVIANFPESLKQTTYKNGFQNCCMFARSGKAYYYYEYVGDDLRYSFQQLMNDNEFTTYQDKLRNCLQSNDNYWKQMREVFHTD